ncbi:uncharacterized protein [Cherax quadricarinatus]|uniref:uncharacterized protein n=1 Tax=Cherax quadricarinatus TaxID=27406 RepID=UPI00387E652C
MDSGGKDLCKENTEDREEKERLKITSLFQKFVQSFSVRYFSRCSFEKFFVENVLFTGDRKDRMNLDVLQIRYAIFCSNKRTFIADPQDTCKHLSFLGLFQEPTEDQYNSFQYPSLLGVIFLTELNAKSVIYSNFPSQSIVHQDSGLPGTSHTDGMIEKCKKSGTSFAWQYPGRESFEAFLSKHLIITHNISDQVSRGNLFAAYTTFCCVHNSQIALVTPILFHLWSLGLAITYKFEDSYGIAGLLIHSGETQESSPDVIILGYPPTAVKQVPQPVWLPKPHPVNTLQQPTSSHNDPSSEVILDSPPIDHLAVRLPVTATYKARASVTKNSVQNTWQHSEPDTSKFLRDGVNVLEKICYYPGMQSLESFCSWHLQITGKKNDVVCRKDFMLFYTAFCKQRNMNAAWLPLVVWHLWRSGVLVQERIRRSFVNYVLLGVKFLNVDDTVKQTSCQKIRKFRHTHHEPAVTPEELSIKMFFNQMVKLTGNPRDTVSRKVLLSEMNKFWKEKGLQPVPPLFTVRYLALLGFRVKTCSFVHFSRHVFRGLCLVKNRSANLKM